MQNLEQAARTEQGGWQAAGWVAVSQSRDWVAEQGGCAACGSTEARRAGRRRRGWTEARQQGTVASEEERRGNTCSGSCVLLLLFCVCRIQMEIFKFSRGILVISQKAGGSHGPYGHLRRSATVYIFHLIIMLRHIFHYFSFTLKSECICQKKKI